jgi:hypothetical protein
MSPKKIIQAFEHSSKNNNKINTLNTNNKDTEQAKTRKIINRTHSKRNMSKTSTIHKHNSKVMYEYKKKLKIGTRA